MGRSAFLSIPDESESGVEPDDDEEDEIIPDNVTLQVFEDPTEKIVEFSTVALWLIGEDNTIEYTLPFGYEEAENDWIGVFRASILLWM